MKKIILTEKQLSNLIKRILVEVETPTNCWKQIGFRTDYEKLKNTQGCSVLDGTILTSRGIVTTCDNKTPIQNNVKALYYDGNNQYCKKVMPEENDDSQKNNKTSNTNEPCWSRVMYRTDYEQLIKIRGCMYDGPRLISSRNTKECGTETEILNNPKAFYYDSNNQKCKSVVTKQ